MLTNTESKAIAAASPSQGEQPAKAAFHNYKFDPNDPPLVRKRPYVPQKYCGRMFEDRSDQSLGQQAELYGLETVEIILPENLAESDPNRSDWGVVGLRGKCLKPGDREEMPVNQALKLVQSGRAVFVISEETVK